jgi:hypothetical protein
MLQKWIGVLHGVISGCRCAERVVGAGAWVPATDAGTGPGRRDAGREVGCGSGSGTSVGATSGR